MYVYTYVCIHMYTVWSIPKFEMINISIVYFFWIWYLLLKWNSLTVSHKQFSIFSNDVKCIFKPM